MEAVPVLVVVTRTGMMTKWIGRQFDSLGVVVAVRPRRYDRVNGDVGVVAVVGRSHDRMNWEAIDLLIARIVQRPGGHAEVPNVREGRAPGVHLQHIRQGSPAHSHLTSTG